MERGLTIIFRRSSNDNEAFCTWGTDSDQTEGTNVSDTIPPDSKIVMRTMEIRIPVVEYETNHATLLKSNMVGNPIIPISFLNSQTVKSSVTGRSAEIDITTQFNSLSFDMNKTNIKISNDFSTAVPANTLCYVVILGEKKLNYDIIQEKIAEVF